MRPHVCKRRLSACVVTSVKSGNDDQALPLSVREPVSIRVMPSSVGVMFGSRPSASARSLRHAHQKGHELVI